MKGAELRPEAKLALQRYVLRILAPAGAGLFILGFILNDVARQNAYNDAYSDASQQIVKLAQEVGGAAKDASRLTSEVKEVAEEARRLQASLETQAAWVESEGGVAEVVEQLSEREDFISRLALDSLGDHHCRWSRWQESDEDSRQMLCEDGRYVKGVEFRASAEGVAQGGSRVLCCNFR